MTHEQMRALREALAQQMTAAYGRKDFAAAVRAMQRLQELDKEGR